MKVALLALLGLALGVLGGAALGIAAGLGWIEIFDIATADGSAAGTVVFTFLPLGAALGGIGGAAGFATIAIRDGQIALERDQTRPNQR